MPVALKQGLRLAAAGAQNSRVDDDSLHYFNKYSYVSQPLQAGEKHVAGSVKTDAIVLRCIRYARPNRVRIDTHPARWRVGAIAKGVRRSDQPLRRPPGPFFHLRLVLHEAAATCSR